MLNRLSNIKKQSKQKLALTATVVLAGLAPQIATAEPCLLSDLGNVWCTGYDFTLPLNVEAATSPAFSVNMRNVDTSSIGLDVKAVNLKVTNAGAQILNNAASINIDAPQNTGTGSISNYYGIYIQSPTAAANNYSIYSVGGKNYFGGDVEVKNTAILKVKTICDNNGANCKDVTLGWGSGGGSGAGTVTQINTGNGLSGGPITSSGTISVDTGTSANKIVQLNGSAQLPAVSGANLTNVNAASINGNSFNITTPSNGQVISFNGTNWSNRNLSTLDITGLSTSLSNKIDAANMPASCGANQTLSFTAPTGMWSCTNIVVTTGMFGTQTASTILAAPAGTNGTPTFRSLNITDLPAGVATWTETGAGDLERINGNVGIGTSATEKLTVGGIIHTTAGGIKFPDGTLQSTAATGGGGGSATGDPVSFKAYRSTELTITDFYQGVFWDDIAWDHASGWLSHMGAYRPSVAGIYLVHFSAGLQQVSGGGQITVTIYQGGVPVARAKPPFVIGNTVVHFTTMVYLDGISGQLQFGIESTGTGSKLSRWTDETYVHINRVSSNTGTYNSPHAKNRQVSPKLVATKNSQAALNADIDSELKKQLAEQRDYRIKLESKIAEVEQRLELKEGVKKIK